MTCIYCDSEVDRAICDDCYEQRMDDILDMICPDCLGEDVVYTQEINMWFCCECEEFFTWEW